MENQNKDIKQADSTLNLDKRLTAHLQDIQPMGRKVLVMVAFFSKDDQWVTSVELRNKLGFTQQLLNRHLKNLAEKGLVELEKQGLGRPTKIRLSSLGRKLLGMLNTTEQADFKVNEDLKKEQVSFQQPPFAEKEEGSSVVEQKEDFISRLYALLCDHLVNLDKQGFISLLKKAVAGEEEDPGRITQDDLALLYQGTSPSLCKVINKIATKIGEKSPDLTPMEQAFEQKLELKVHPNYKHLVWYKRTDAFCFVWDQTRKHRMGIIGSFFTSFAPKWENSNWVDFNKARRQADIHGADYGDWITAQFDRLSPKGLTEVKPKDLHGNEALTCYMVEYGERQRKKVERLGDPPYQKEEYNPDDPKHIAYAEQLLQEMDNLGKDLFSEDQKGFARFLFEAVDKGRLPLKALDLKPEWRAIVLTEQRRDEKNRAKAKRSFRPPQVI